MQNTEDRRRLLERHGGEQQGPLAAVLRCAAGLLALAAVAAGPWLVLSADIGGRAEERPASAAATSIPNSMAESRRVFEERRQRVQGERQGADRGTRAALAR